MKATIQTKDLSALLGLALSVAKSTDAIQLICERAGEDVPSDQAEFTETSPEPGTIRVIAFNDTTTCEWRRSAEISMPGSIAIEAGPLDKFVKASIKSDGTLMIATRDTDNARAVRIGTGRGSHEFECLPEALFRSVAPGGVNGGLGDLKNLARAMTIAQIASAAENEAMGSRIALTGIHIRPVDGMIHVVGTDGRRLSLAMLRDTEAGSVSLDAIPDGATIPARMVAVLAKIMQDGPTKIAFDQSSLIVETPEGVISTKLIDAAFPDYTRLLSFTTREALDLDVNMLTTALSRSSASISRDDRLTGVEVIRDETGVYLSSRTDQQSSSELIQENGGSEVSIGFDARYMSAALKAFSSAKGIKLSFQDAQTPIYITSDQLPDITMIVMPMRI